jgi:hypothetical protein
MVNLFGQLAAFARQLAAQDFREPRRVGGRIYRIQFSD